MVEKKASLIAGSGGRLDAVLAKALIDRGNSVELLVHGGRTTARMPAQALVTSVDFNDEDSISAAVLSLIAREGKIDGLVNCPDFRINRPLTETTAKEWEESVSLNLTSVFLVCKHVVPFMMERKSGRIINFSSDAARMGAPDGAAYAAAKAGVITFSKSLAREVAAFGIRVNVLSLGMMDEDVAPMGGETDISGIPLKRTGKWEEAAQAAICLLDDKLEYLTGQTVHVNGGLYMP